MRVNDNRALSEACRHQNCVAVYCFDPTDFELGEFAFTKTGKFRAKFLIQSVQELKKSLAELNISLLIFFEYPKNCIPKLISQHNIDHVYLQTEWTRDEYQLLESVKNGCDDAVNFVESCDQFLYHPEDVPFENFSKVPDVFTFFRKKVEKYGSIKPLIEKPQIKPVTNRIKDETKVPTLNELGFEDFEIDNRSAFPFEGGESKALERLQHYFWNTQKLASYKKTRNGLVGLDYSSKFSPWLANGCISAKTIYWSIKQFEQEKIKNQDTYWLYFELLWRDFFKYISLKYDDKIFHLGGILNRRYDWGNSIKLQEQWISGNTNEPFVNANMKELALTGWMSNRGRQNVASYWAKELKQDWRIGAAYFESMLIDYDVHSNWCNWMYLSGVGNDPRDRKFNIKRQAQIYDPKNTYQNLWLK